MITTTTTTTTTTATTQELRNFTLNSRPKPWGEPRRSSKAAAQINSARHDSKIAFLYIAFHTSFDTSERCKTNCILLGSPVY